MYGEAPETVSVSMVTVSQSRSVSYWRLEDNGDDSSSNSNNLTVTGATFTTDVPS